jgi:hypothetical protein
MKSTRKERRRSVPPPVGWALGKEDIREMSAKWVICMKIESTENRAENGIKTTSRGWVWWTHL